MENKKKYLIVLILLIFIGLMIFTFANPNEEYSEKKGSEKTTTTTSAVKTDEDKTNSEDSNDRSRTTTKRVLSTIESNDSTQASVASNDSEETSGNPTTTQPETTTKPAEKVDLLSNAKELVEQAEKSYANGDYNSAKNAVDNLPNSDDKKALEDRLAVIEEGFQLEKLVDSLVNQVNERNSKEDMDSARTVESKNNITSRVEKFTGKSEVKERLQDKLNSVSPILEDETLPEVSLDNGTKLTNGDEKTVKSGKLTATDANELFIKVNDEEEQELTKDGYTLPSSDGKYIITVRDSAYNEATVTITIDTIIPEAENISIKSSNENTNYAKIGDIITVTLKLNEEVTTLPKLNMLGETLILEKSSDDNKLYTVDYTITGDEKEFDQGVVGISIYGYADAAGNTGTTLDNNSDKMDKDHNQVIIDTIAPEMSFKNGKLTVVEESNFSYTIYRVNPDGTETRVEGPNIHMGDAVLDLTKHGDGTYRVEITDKAGSTVEGTYTYDNTPIEITKFEYNIRTSSNKSEQKLIKENDMINFSLTSKEKINNPIYIQVTGDSKEFEFQLSNSIENPNPKINADGTYTYWFNYTVLTPGSYKNREITYKDNDNFEFTISGLTDEFNNGVSFDEKTYQDGTLTQKDIYTQDGRKNSEEPLKFDFKPVEVKVKHVFNNKDVYLTPAEDGIYYSKNSGAVAVSDDKDIYSKTISGIDYNFGTNLTSNATLEVTDKVGHVTKVTYIQTSTIDKVIHVNNQLLTQEANSGKTLNVESANITYGIVGLKSIKVTKNEEDYKVEKSEGINGHYNGSFSLTEPGNYHIVFEGYDVYGVNKVPGDRKFEFNILISNVSSTLGVKEAIGSATEGDVIVLPESTTLSNVSIPKGVTIVGNDSSKIQNLEIQNDDVTLTDVVISGQLNVKANDVTLNNVTAKSTSSGALTIGADKDGKTYENIVINGGTYDITGEPALEGEGALRIFNAKNITIKGIKIKGGIHLLNYEGSLKNISNNEINLSDSTPSAISGIIVSYPSTLSENPYTEADIQNLYTNNTLNVHEHAYYILVEKYPFEHQMKMVNNVEVEAADWQKDGIISVAVPTGATKAPEVSSYSAKAQLPEYQEPSIEVPEITEKETKTEEENSNVNVATTKKAIVPEVFPYINQAFKIVKTDNIIKNSTITVTSDNDEGYQALIAKGYKPVNVIWWAQFSCDTNKCEGFKEHPSYKMVGTVVEGRRGDVSITMEAPKAKEGYTFIGWEPTIVEYSGIKIQAFEALYEDAEEIVDPETTETE